MRPGDLDLLTLKVVSESRVTCMHGLPVTILVFLGLSVLDLGPLYAADRQTYVRQHHRLIINNVMSSLQKNIFKKSSGYRIRIRLFVGTVEQDLIDFRFKVVHASNVLCNQSINQSIFV